MQRKTAYSNKSENIIDALLMALASGNEKIAVSPKIIKEIDKSKAKIVYVCNIMTQPGETDNFKVSNHVSLLNKYLGKRKIDVVIANNGQIDKNVIEKYASLEQKDQVELDKEELKKMKVKVIKDDLISIENEQIRHDTLKLAFYIYATLIKN